jgi:pyridoxamine 5'-phosphate oxidase
MTGTNIQSIRDRELSETDVSRSPFKQFQVWYGDTFAADILTPEAATLATVGDDGSPAARMVLLKDFDENGFVFFTNYESDKARHLSRNPRTCLVFYWKEFERQVRIGGSVEKVSREESEAYFKTRPYGSQIGAWASRQSSVIENRQVLEKRFADLKEKYPEGRVPLPPFWGGYRIMPVEFEFWQGRENRLHDRIRYRLYGDGWKVERLSP